MTEIINRKGARKLQDIPVEVLNLLNEGKIASVNLTEWLAIDHIKLIKSNCVALGLSEMVLQQIEEKLRAEKKLTAMLSTKLIGAVLYQYYADDKDYVKVLSAIRKHTSDAIRTYATYMIALNDKLSVVEKLEQSKDLVADHHFGVREVVWMALRPAIDEQLEAAIAHLSLWAEDEDENIRRFTTEATRPRGVWCKHIEALKEKPALAIAILDKLKSDPSKYVQDSVGNWLNDASKTKADFVIDLCERWQKESTSKATIKIIKRAKRSLDKK